MSNVCYESTEYSLTVLENGILDNIITIFNFVTEKKKLRDFKDGVIRLFSNMKGNIKNPEDVKNNEVLFFYLIFFLFSILVKTTLWIMRKSL